MTKKVCIQCGVEKDITEFHKSSRNKTGSKGTCKQCCALNARKYKDKASLYRKRYESKPESKAKRKEYLKKYTRTAKHREYMNKYQNKPDRKQKSHEYTTTQEYKDKINKKRWDNIETYREKERIYNRKRRQIPEVKIKSALRARLQGILKRSDGSKSKKMVEIIGCTMPFLRQYLESLWKENMTWSNYGLGRGRWVIDHIVSCDKFDLTKPEEQRKCFHYTNLQPLWWEENAAKSNK